MKQEDFPHVEFHRSEPQHETNFFRILPSSLLVDIFSRLPLGSLIRCKFVCKSSLIEFSTPEFVKLLGSKLVPGLAVLDCNGFDFFEHQDGPRFNSVLKFNTPKQHHNIKVIASVNGLFFIIRSCRINYAYIWNPLTRECIELGFPDHKELGIPSIRYYGFGWSRVSGQYKVIRVSHGDLKSDCVVYTLGTESWREIAADDHPKVAHSRNSNRNSNGVLLHDNLHWLVSGKSPWISCFELENEFFTALACPPIRDANIKSFSLVALHDFLCFCDHAFANDNRVANNEVVIWAMMEYGDHNSWTRQYVVTKGFVSYMKQGVFNPIKVWKDGDVLMVWSGFGEILMSYSEVSQRCRKINSLGLYPKCHALLHTPSFLSLKGFKLEKVINNSIKLDLLFNY